MRVMLFVQTGDARPKVARKYGAAAIIPYIDADDPWRADWRVATGGPDTYCYVRSGNMIQRACSRGVHLYRRGDGSRGWALAKRCAEREAAFRNVVRASDRWWLVECASADAGRLIIACSRGECDSPEGCVCKNYGRILASGGRHA